MKNIDVYHKYNCIKYENTVILDIDTINKKYDNMKNQLENRLLSTNDIDNIICTQKKLYNIINLKNQMIDKNNNIIKNFMEMNRMMSSYYIVSTYNDKKRIFKEYLLKFNKKQHDDLYIDKNINNGIKCCNSDNFVCEDFEYNIYRCNICNKHIENKICSEKIIENKINNSIKINNYKRFEYFNLHVEMLFLKYNKNVSDKILKSVNNYIIKNNINIKYCFDFIKFNFILIKLKIKLSKSNMKWLFYKIKYKKIELDNKDKKIMVNMFFKIENIWNSIRGERRSFINYRYCILKILQILKKYKTVQSMIITNLKNNNILKLDDFWHKICNKNNWEYIPTYC